MLRNYYPNILLRHGHINTIFSTVFSPGKKDGFERERIELSDGDFIDVDYLRGNNEKLLVVLHGLEGSSASGYMLETADYFSNRGWDICLVNHRGCSGESNRLARSYHSGNTSDLHELVGHINSQHKYRLKSVLGYSLGGNVTLKFAAELNNANTVDAAIGVSVPCDLKGAAHRLAEKENFIYNRRFLKRLKKKLQIKAKAHSEIKRVLPSVASSKRLQEFDELYTAPFHGFKNAEDYYQKASSLPLLSEINIPAMLLNAQDDPFLSISCFPKISGNEKLELLYSKYGGHVGFYRKDYWLFPVIEAFLLKNT